MRIFRATIPIGLGDLIYTKAMFEPIKQSFSEICLTFHRELINKFEKDLEYNTFLNEIGALLFSGEPYKIDVGSYPYCSLSEMVTAHGLVPRKPELSNILCSGNPLNLEEPYIVINTKVRSVPRQLLEQTAAEFWQLLSELSKKYKIVILGERIVEMNQEYQYYTKDYIYSMYKHINENITSERILDLTVPALGITTPNLKQIQQDCLIMNQAKFVINFGIGGGFCMATSVANVIGYRYDDDYIANLVFDEQKYHNSTITKDWATFMNALRQYNDPGL